MHANYVVDRCVDNTGNCMFRAQLRAYMHHADKAGRAIASDLPSDRTSSKNRIWVDFPTQDEGVG